MSALELVPVAVPEAVDPVVRPEVAAVDLVVRPEVADAAHREDETELCQPNDTR